MNYFWKSCRMAFALISLCMITGCGSEKESKPTGVLVTTDWLQNHLNDSDLVILHAGSAEFFDSLHIPGSRLIVPAEFTLSDDSLYNEIPSVDTLISLLRSAGVHNSSVMVLYSEDSGLLSRTARIYLTLDYLGLGDRIFLLNGGLPAWEEEQRETTDEVEDFSPGDLVAGSIKDVIIRAAELDSLRWNSDFVLVDARGDEEYYGTPAAGESPAEGGHIEGAYYLPYQSNLMDEKPDFFKPDAELEEMVRRAGMEPGKTTIVYCGSGIRASVNYLVARHLHYPVLLYDGSYEEWVNLNLPITGPVDLPPEND